MAFEDDGILCTPLRYVEVGLHRFGIGDTLRVRAASKSTYLGRESYLMLLDDLVVSDDIQTYLGGKQGDALDVLRRYEVIS